MKSLNTCKGIPSGEDLSALKDHIEHHYAGDYASLSLELSKAIYLLHYLEKDVIISVDIRNTCYALQQLNECFYRAHRKQK